MCVCVCTLFNYSSILLPVIAPKHGDSCIIRIVQHSHLIMSADCMYEIYHSCSSTVNNIQCVAMNANFTQSIILLSMACHWSAFSLVGCTCRCICMITSFSHCSVGVVIVVGLGT